MTRDPANARISDAMTAMTVTVVALVPAGGAMLGLSSLFGARWWVSLIIILVAASMTFAAFESDEETGIGLLVLLSLFSLYGYVSTLGWIATVAIILVSAGLIILLLSDVLTPGTPSVGRRDAAPSSPPSPPRTVADETLEQYARQFLADGGRRDRWAVIASLRSRLQEENLRLGPSQDLTSIANRALASTKPPATPPKAPRATKPPPTEPSRSDATRSSSKARRHLHEFGSFEIERAISSILDASPGLTDKQLVGRTLSALGTDDRSPFAMERLSDAIGRVRGIASPSAEERQVERRERRVARVPRRDPGGRTKLYEYGSHEIERVVEQLLAADRQLSAKALHEAVLDVLGIEDRSNLARERVADAAAKVAASPIRPSGAGGWRRQPARKKKSTKKAQKPAAKKATKEKAPVAKNATKKQAPVAKKATKKQAPVAKKATKKQAPVAKKATKGTSRQNDASTSEQNRQAGRKTPPPASEKRPTKPDGDTGAPDAKDIGKLLGF